MKIGIHDVLEAFDIKSARIIFVFNDDRIFLDDEIFCSRALLMKILISTRPQQWKLCSAFCTQFHAHFTLYIALLSSPAALSSTILPDQLDLERNLFKELVLFFCFFCVIFMRKKSKYRTKSFNEFRLRFKLFFFHISYLFHLIIQHILHSVISHIFPYVYPYVYPCVYPCICPCICPCI